MEKEEFLLRLRAIVREITCMNPSVFDEEFKEGIIRFDHFCWNEENKIHTEISMKKIPVEENNEST